MSAPHPRIKLDNTFGAALIALVVTATVYGITTLQTYFFYLNYPEDVPTTKLLVAVIWTLDTAHTVMITMGVYHYLISNYANPVTLLYGSWALVTSTLLNALIAFLVHSFFTMQIYKLCKPKHRSWVTAMISLFIVAHLGFALVSVVLSYKTTVLTELRKLTLLSSMPFALCAVLANLSIAVTLCILLHGSKVGIRDTDHILHTLVVYAVNRCVLTSIVAIVESVLFGLSPNTLWFLAIDFVVGKLYANSLLASLNSRHSLRTRKNPLQSLPMTGIDFLKDTQPRTDSSHDSHGVVVDVTSDGLNGKIKLTPGGNNDNWSKAGEAYEC